MTVADHLDTHPNLYEVILALRSTNLGKASGSDGIPQEILKLDIPHLTLAIYCIMCLCWEEGTIPQDMKDAQLITLFKNKGSRKDCNNYQAISLLSLVGKLFRTLLSRLQVLTDRVYPKGQCGFRKKRLTNDMLSH